VKGRRSSSRGQGTVSFFSFLEQGEEVLNLFPSFLSFLCFLLSIQKLTLSRPSPKKQKKTKPVAADIAGRGVANPTSALLTASMMLRHLNLPDFSDRLSRAVLGALADAPEAAKTPDIGGKGTTATFLKEVKARLHG